MDIDNLSEFQHMVVTRLYVDQLKKELAQQKLENGYLQSELDELKDLYINNPNKHRDEIISHVCNEVNEKERVVHLLARCIALQEEIMVFNISNRDSKKSKIEKWKKQLEDINPSGFYLVEDSEKICSIIEATREEIDAKGLKRRSKCFKIKHDLIVAKNVLRNPCSCCGSVIHGKAIHSIHSEWERLSLCKGCYYSSVILGNVKADLIRVGSFILYPKNLKSIRFMVIQDLSDRDDFKNLYPEIFTCLKKDYWKVGYVYTDHLEPFFEGVLTVDETNYKEVLIDHKKPYTSP